MQDGFDRPIVAKGYERIIACAVQRNRGCPARDFLEDLEKSDLATLRKFAVTFQHMADAGVIGNKQRFRKVQGIIWEFKYGQYRIVCYQDGRVWVLTHGFIKKCNKCPTKELKRANRIAQEDKDRIAEKGKRRK